VNIKDHINKDDETIAQLAVAYTLLAMAPFDNWSHEGTPAQMAAYVVACAKRDGRMGFVQDIVLGKGR